jgi:hypothetical protein
MIDPLLFASCTVEGAHFFKDSSDPGGWNRTNAKLQKRLYPGNRTLSTEHGRFFSTFRGIEASRQIVAERSLPYYGLIFFCIAFPMAKARNVCFQLVLSIGSALSQFPLHSAPIYQQAARFFGLSRLSRWSEADNKINPAGFLGRRTCWAVIRASILSFPDICVILQG